MSIYFSPPLLSLLEPQFKKTLRAAGLERQFADGQLIHSQGDSRAGLSVIWLGAVRFGLYGREGDYVQTGILEQGHCFGEATLFANRPRAYDAEAIGDTVVLDINERRFHRLVAESPAFSLACLESLTGRLYDALEFADDLRSLSAEARVARQLWRYAIAGDFNDDVVPIRQSDLAAVLGLSRVSVGKALDVLQKRELLMLGYKQIKIVDREGLAVIV